MKPDQGTNLYYNNTARTNKKQLFNHKPTLKKRLFCAKLLVRRQLQNIKT